MERSRWDIMASILRAARHADSKTHIMYKANLSYRQLEKYLEFLLDRGLLRVLEVSHSKVVNLYLTTDKGVCFLKAYRRLKDIVREGRFSLERLVFPEEF